MERQFIGIIFICNGTVKNIQLCIACQMKQDLGFVISQVVTVFRRSEEAECFAAPIVENK